MIPFSSEAFLRLFAQYNAAIWPAQVAAFVLGLIAVWLVLRPRGPGGRLIAAILAAFWLWSGIAYHMLYFATINWAAWGFGALFALQGIFILWSGTLRGRLEFRFTERASDWVGLGLAVFALALQPTFGWVMGRDWPELAMFGVTPCPTTLFTLGLLLLCQPRVPLGLLMIPLLWSLIGGSAALFLDIREDLLLLIAGPVSLVLAVAKNRALRKPCAAQ